MNKDQAARVNCKSFAEARGLKSAQLEREIQQSSATPTQKANMLHTLSKLTMFASDERDQLVRLGTTSKSYRKWLAIPPDGSS